ncbi:hypothetical protein Btru_004657 [Bulinus truncatus]|nr:hypothetical protein Btru_004657 [Bulinus truncatus]
MSPIALAIFTVTVLGKLDSAKAEVKWQLYFRGVADNGVDLYAAFMNGVGTHKNLWESCKKVAANSSACRNFYRNDDILSHWDRVKWVRFSILKRAEEMKFIVFDGEHSDPLHWFDRNRIKNSSWVDLRHQHFKNFSIQGTANRKFLIASGNTRRGCDNDAGYFVAIVAKTGSCNYDKVDSIPTFRYSKLATSAKFSSKEFFSQADAIEVLVSF